MRTVIRFHRPRWDLEWDGEARKSQWVQITRTAHEAEEATDRLREDMARREVATGLRREAVTAVEEVIGVVHRLQAGTEEDEAAMRLLRKACVLRPCRSKGLGRRPATEATIADSTQAVQPWLWVSAQLLRQARCIIRGRRHLQSNRRMWLAQIVVRSGKR